MPSLLICECPGLVLTSLPIIGVSSFDNIKTSFDAQKIFLQVSADLVKLSPSYEHLKLIFSTLEFWTASTPPVAAATTAGYNLCPRSDPQAIMRPGRELSHPHLLR